MSGVGRVRRRILLVVDAPPRALDRLGQRTLRSERLSGGRSVATHVKPNSIHRAFTFRPGTLKGSVLDV
jgi:hypothetical protein